MENDTNETLVMPGNAVKALGIKNGKGRIGGYLVVFGDAEQTDLAGDWFTAKTYLGPADGNGAEAVFHHTLPIKGFEQMRDYRFAPLTTKRDSYGIFAETVVDMANDYDRAVYGVAAAGKLGWSSGSAPHLVRRAEGKTAGEITHWPIVEGSLTPCPCEPRARATNLKALDAVPDDVFEVPADVQEEIKRQIEGETIDETNAAKTALQRRIIGIKLEFLKK